MNAEHAHDLVICDWQTCICGRKFKSSRSLHMHVTKANKVIRDAKISEVDR
jgi:hypothetical protein